MKIELKKSHYYKNTPLILSFLCIISGALCGLLGEIALPLPVAFLASLYLFDNTNHRTVSVVTSSLLVVMNIAGLLLKLSLSAFGPAAIILAFIMYYAFSHKQSKADSSFVMTVICAVFSLLSYILLAMHLQGQYSIEAAMDFYSSLTSLLKESFVSLMLEAYTAAGIAVAPELLTKIFEYQLNMIISYLLIAAFFIVGISFKIFSLIVRKCTEDKREITSWRFFTSNVFAYFYVLVAFASIFMVSLDGVISIAVLNLYNLFLVVYAYVGFNVAFAMLTKKFKPFVSFLLLIVTLLIFVSLGIQILAALGVLFTIRKNNEVALTNK